MIQVKGRGPHPGKDSRTPVRRVNLFSLLLEPTRGGGTASQCQEQAFLHDSGRRRRRHTQARAGKGALFVSKGMARLVCVYGWVGERVRGWRQRKQAKEATTAAALCSRVVCECAGGCARASWADTKENKIR